MVLYTFHLFAGAGGGILADLLLGHCPIGAVEIDPYCRNVLLQRQRDGLLPAFPIWDDVRTCRLDNPDTRPFLLSLRERAESLALCGGFPCQDISNAGTRAGITGPRSGLWTEFARLLGEVRPRYAFIENTAALAVRGLDRVLSDLAAVGMDARWCCLGADDVGAPHIRKRLWILADRASLRVEEQSLSAQGSQPMGHAERCGTEVADTDCSQWRQDGMAYHTEGCQLLCQRQESPTGIGTSRQGVADAECPRGHGLYERQQPGYLDTNADRSGPDEPGRATSDHHGRRVPREGTDGSPSDPDKPGLALRQSQRSHTPEKQSSAERTDRSTAQSNLGGMANGLAPGLGGSWATEPADVPRVATAVSQRIARLRALGNGQVPLCAARAWQILMSDLRARGED